jgi:hypothetical protein
MRIPAWCAVLLWGVLTLTGARAGGEYRLLVLDGFLVKWGDPELGRGAVVSYALARREMRFQDARNCPGMRPAAAIAPDLSESRIERELENAFAAWEAVADLRFVPAPDPDQADILIGAQLQPHGYAYANVDRQGAGAHPALAAGFGPSARPRGPAERVDTIRRSLICLNPTRSWKSGFDGELTVYDLRYTLMHEIGHAIGLDHPHASGELMSFRYEETFRAPQPGDIAGAVRLYGPPEAASR